MDRSNTFLFSFSWLLSAVIFVAGLFALTQGQWFNAFLSFLAFGLTYTPALMERNFRIVLPLEFEVIMVFFIFTSLYLGEVRNYYYAYWWWDVVIHTSSGFVMGLVGFVVVYILTTQDKVKVELHPFMVGVFSFLFSVAIGALWEIFEFFLDTFFDLNMQSGDLFDTMIDMIVNLIGAFFFSFLGYFYLSNGKTHLLNGLFQKFIEGNPRLFKKRRNR